MKAKLEVRCPVHSASECGCTTEYRIYSAVMGLPSYGLIANDRDNPMISRKAVLKLLEPRKARQPDLGEGFC